MTGSISANSMFSGTVVEAGMSSEVVSTSPVPTIVAARLLPT